MLFLVAAAADFVLFAGHVAAIFIGEPAYIFLRAGKAMAAADTRGEIWPALLTAFVSVVFLAWAIVTFWASKPRAYSKAARYLVIAIGVVFLLRGGIIVFQVMGLTAFSDGEVPQFRDFIFSASAILIGLVHLGAVRTKS